MALVNPPATLPQLTPTRVSPKTVETAVNALLKWRNSKSENQKPQLLGQDDFIYLILTLKKVPPKGRTNAFKIPLPHSLIDSNSSEFCLIFDDRSNSGLSKDDVKKKIQSENIPVSKVIKLSKLKSDYRPFEAKRKLCGSYDMFFADRRIVHMLPKMLGKHFFKRKKIPVPVDLKHKNWKQQIEKACDSAMLYMRSGTCSVVKVGRLSMGVEDIVGNVMAAINGIVEMVPKKWGNVRSFHLKFMDSLALPVYQAVPDMKLKIEGVKNEEEEKVEGDVEEEEQKTDKTAKKKKGKIHEVRYMDHSTDDVVVDEDNLDDVDGDVIDGGVSEDEEVKGAELVSKKKKKKGTKKTEEVLKELNEEVKGAELVGKKRKKGTKKTEEVLKELNAEKEVKKIAKLENDDGTKNKKKKLAKDDDGSENKKKKLSEDDDVPKTRKGKSSKKGEESEAKVTKEKKSPLKRQKSGELKVNAKKSKKATG